MVFPGLDTKTKALAIPCASARGQGIRGDISTAEQNRDTLALGRNIGARLQRGQSGRARRFNEHPHPLPKVGLRLGDRGIIHKNGPTKMGLRKIKAHLPHTAGPKGIGGNARHLDINRRSGV